MTNSENAPPEEPKNKKRKERLEQNRVSARESRKRKKSMIEELQRTVITLSRENKELHESNETLRRHLVEISSKYPNVVSMQAIIGGANQGPTTVEQQQSGQQGNSGSVSQVSGGLPQGAASSGAFPQAMFSLYGHQGMGQAWPVGGGASSTQSTRMAVPGWETQLSGSNATK